MKTIVCIKQVPSTNVIRLDPVTHTIMRDGRQSDVNPFDLHALEAAIRIKERLGGSVTVLSMGIPATERLIRDAIARGADDGMLLSDRAFAGSDTLATSYTLSLGVKRAGGFDLIICGKMAIDGDTAQIGPELAAKLDIPHISDVSEICEVEPGHIVCRKVTDDGFLVVRAELPALITVNKSINYARLPSITGIRRSAGAPLETLGAAALGADSTRVGIDGSATKVVRTFVPNAGKNTAMLNGDGNAQAGMILEIISEAKQ